MKKVLSVIFTLFAGIVILNAIPADPAPFKYTQPDGSVVTLVRHGDEFFSWTTDLGGNVMVLGADGYYRPGSISAAERAEGIARRKELERMRAADRESRIAKRGTQNSDPMTHGERHIPVVLVEFSDVKFMINNPAQQFTNLLNQEGYSTNGATGSVRDFYVSNSDGIFLPSFDVIGKVSLSNTCEYYAYNKTARAAEALIEAVNELDASVNFANYDYDNDGYVDMILMYYAGHNQAEGAANTIWPHQGYASYSSSKRYDGKRLGRYFCTSELKGSSGSTMCGIGTTCHEFGHSIGLPDFYDTDYEENGQTHALSVFSTMCSGSYLNSSRTPPYFNTEERIFLGWMADSDVPELISGSVTIKGVQTEAAYRSYTDTEGEYFLYEYRDGTGWDTYLPQGLTVCHIDKSKGRSVGGHTPFEHWNNWEYYNEINAYGDHPCYYIIAPSNQSSLNYSVTRSYSELVFPGYYSVSSYSPVDWDGNSTGTTIKSIALNSGKTAVSFTASSSTVKCLYGVIKDSSGRPVDGASVSVSSYKTTTDAKGEYNLNLSSYTPSTGSAVFSKAGFKTKTIQTNIGSRGTELSLTMYREGEPEPVVFDSVEKGAQTTAIGEGNSPKMYCAAKISSSDLATYAGCPIKSVSLTLSGGAPSELFLVFEYNGRKQICIPVKEPVGGENVIDVSEYGLTLPSNGDFYYGYAVTGDSNYPAMAAANSSQSGNFYYSDYTEVSSFKASSWEQYSAADLVISLSILDQKAQTASSLGFASLYQSAKPVSGEAFPLCFKAAEGKEPASIIWLYDGDRCSTNTVVLKAGESYIEAIATYSNGTEETILLPVFAN